MPTIRSLSPVLPVADIDAAAAHYRRLGFTVERYEGSDPYAFATRDGVTLHLSEAANLDPSSTTSAVYLYVDDADELCAEWSADGIAGRTVAPVDAPYGLREGAHVDPDGNLLRFGAR